MANANAATFDGSNDYLTRGADLTGNADSKQFACSLWIKRGINDTTQFVVHGSGNEVIIRFNSDNTFQFQMEAAGSVDTVDLSTSTITDTSNWHNILCSFDLSDVNKRHLYVDDVSDLAVSVYDDANINFTVANHSIGGNVNGDIKFIGDLSILWINYGQYVDFSVEENRRIFVTSDIKLPQSLANSTNGDVGGLGQPLMFFNNPFDTYQTNLGSGGGFTENGELAETTGPEISSGNIILRRRRQFIGAF